MLGRGGSCVTISHLVRGATNEEKFYTIIKKPSRGGRGHIPKQFVRSTSGDSEEEGGAER
jgi:hypothetical protein